MGHGLQDQGNEDFKRGLQLKKKFFVQQALVKYTEGLKIQGLRKGHVMSTLLSNRSQAQLRLLNNRSALEDAIAAIELDGTNVKVVRQPHRFEICQPLCRCEWILTNNSNSRRSLVPQTPIA